MAKTYNFSDVWEYLSSHTLKDVDSSIATVVAQIKSLQQEGKYTEAAALVNSNNLKEYVLTADYINAIDEKTRNLEIDITSSGQHIYFTDDQPNTTTCPYLSENDVWIGG